MLCPNIENKWHPICDTFDELTRNVNKSSNQIKVNLKDEETKILSLYFSLSIPNFNDDENNETSKIRLPSVIQKIPVVNTRQYWEKVIGYDGSIIRKACQIPIPITNHLQTLQQKFSKDRQSILELIAKQLNISMITDVENSDGKFDLSIVNPSEEYNVLGHNGDFDSMINGSFKSKQDLKDRLTCIQRSSTFVFVSKAYIIAHFFENDNINYETLKEKCDLLDSAAKLIAKDEKFEMDSTLAIETYFFAPLVFDSYRNVHEIVRLMTRKFGYTDMYRCYGRLVSMNAKNDHKNAIFMCEYLLRRFKGSMLDKIHYQWLLIQVLFEYCKALNSYNQKYNWKDKDIMFLCHYYLSLYIALDQAILCHGGAKQKDKIRLAIATGMLAESYWHIGKLLNDTKLIGVAAIHFEMAIHDNYNSIVPTKFNMFHQCHNVNSRSNVFIDIKDVKMYQQIWSKFVAYLVSNEYRSMFTKSRIVIILHKMLDVFGCSLDTFLLMQIYNLLAKSYENVIDYGRAIVCLQNIIDIAKGKFCQSCGTVSINEMSQNAQDTLLHMQNKDKTEVKKPKINENNKRND